MLTRLAFLSAVLALAAFAQPGPMIPSREVPGHPFSAQEETETVQTLSDGTHITNPAQKVMHYRDSAGRTRTERTPPQPPGLLAAASPPVFIEISDPVAGYRYSLDSNSHIAHRSPMRVMPSNPTPPPAQGSVGKVIRPAQRIGRPEISSESLGTQNIEGALAEGTRTTTVWPIGAVGNDRPITAISETWTSRDLGMPVLTKRSDPRSGETSTKLTNISLSEPDPSLFQPPPGYEIVDPQ
jgi:hypothetical protein